MIANNHPRTQGDAAVLLALAHPGPWTDRALASAANSAAGGWGVRFMAWAATEDPGLRWLISCPWQGGLAFAPERER